MSGSVHHATLSSIAPLADGVFAYSLRLDAEEATLAWRPGQFISIECGKSSDGNPVLRSYSIASTPGSGLVQLVVKLVPGGVASTWLQARMEGDRVRFTGPMGFFVNELAHAGDVVYAATGVGIAPVLPMVREVLARPSESGRVLVRWGMRHERDLFWQDELTRLVHPRLGVQVHVSQASPEWKGGRGRVTPALVEELPALHDPTFYLVGNGAMITEAKQQLVAAGVDRKKRIRTEAFFD